MKTTYAVPTLPGAVPHDEVYITCEPTEIEERVERLVRRNPEWFMTRQPVIYGQDDDKS